MTKSILSNATILRCGILAAAIILIFYFQPQADQSRYHYEVNRPWNYGLLTAPFDIPVHLDSIRSQAIRDSLDTHFEPVFYRDKNTEEKIISEYVASLNKNATIRLSATERNALITRIRQVYDTGILDFNAFNTSDRMPSSVRLLSDNVATSVPLGHFLSPRQAYARIDSTLSANAQHQAIAATSLAEFIKPNIVPDSLETERFRKEAYQSALAPIGVVQQGERIVDRGDIVTPQLYTILSTYEQMAADRGADINASRYYHALGSILFLLILFGALYVYLYFFRHDYYQSIRTISLLMLVITTTTLFTFGMSATFSLGIYIVPFTIVPIILLVFLDSRTAFFSSLITLLLCTVVARFPWEFIILQTVASITALASIKELSKRSQLIRTALTVFIAYSLTYVTLELMQSGSPDGISTRMFGALAINAVLISFAYILIFLIEKMFGFISRVTLVELSDINHPLLRELSEECPGSFQHSMAISSLAAAAASRIGANVQLVRAGALYHDIGKISNPAFFTENQHGVNPHDALSPMQSARIVISHVAEGLKRAEKAKLPGKIKDFITQHHGLGKARFFYTTYCNEHPDEKVDESPFTYPGPNPQSRETSIVMMADAVEAASRSLPDHSPESITKLVNRIIDTQISEGLHNDSPLSFRDVNEIKSTFISRLRTMYHSRISYPESIKPEEKPEATAQP